MCGTHLSRMGELGLRVRVLALGRPRHNVDGLLPYVLLLFFNKKINYYLILKHIYLAASGLSCSTWDLSLQRMDSTALGHSSCST